VPLALADPACLPRREADGDADGPSALLDPEGVGHVAFEVEPDGGTGLLPSDGYATDAVEREVAHGGATRVPGHEVPRAAHVEDAVRVDRPVERASGAGARVAQGEAPAAVEPGDDVAKDSGVGLRERPRIQLQEGKQALRPDNDLRGKQRLELAEGAREVPLVGRTPVLPEDFSAK
jgi:hypothetical protein